MAKQKKAKTGTSNFFNKLVEDLDDEGTKMASDGAGAAECTGFIDTGSYIFNALLSGSIYGGIPNNRVTALAGEEATGKTFFALGVVKHFLDSNPTGGVIYYDTEAAISKSLLVQRGIDINRCIVAETETVQKFRHHVLQTLESYEKLDEEDRPPMLMVLDSLGMLSTTKEMEDTAKGADTRDMTRAQILKATFRVVTLKLAKLKVPLVVTNHTYDVVGSYFPMKTMGGGSGLKYAASTIIYLSKKKEKDSKDVVVGNIIKCKTQKSRLSLENRLAEVLLTYKSGLDKYYGLLGLAEKHGIIEKGAKQYTFPGQDPAFEKHINASPEKYFTSEVLALIEEAAKQEFLYGQPDEMQPEQVVEEEVTQ